MKISNCKNCGKEIRYQPACQTGTWCSNQCQGDYKVKQRFVEGTTWRYSMRNYILRQRGEKCEECGITNWNGKSLAFHIDHINGDRKDNRLENLKVMCPNCHSQTETFGIKNESAEGKQRRIKVLSKHWS